MLFIGCFGSFTWGMRRFFSRPLGSNAMMRLVVICGVVSAALHLAALLLPASGTAGRRVLGAALYLAAFLLFWSATAAWGKAGRPSVIGSPDEPSQLMQRGPYRWIRHPFYTSYLLAWSAGWVATGRWWLAPTVLILFGVYVIAALAEEQKFAVSPLAGAYANYRARTGLFIPNPLKFAVPRDSRRGTYHAAGVE